MSQRLIHLSQLTNRQRRSQQSPNSQSKPNTNPKQSSSGNKWVVQLGSFSQRANADKLLNKLKNDFSKLYIEQVDIPGGITYRLRLGDFADKDKAIAQRRRIKSQYGIPGVVMAKD